MTNRLGVIVLVILVLMGVGGASATEAGDRGAQSQSLDQLLNAGKFTEAEPVVRRGLTFYSDATVKLITTAVAEMAGEPQIGRAEALRRSMLVLIDKGASHEAHPAYWAPFVVVGEGGRGR
jgi:hypothetical protein